MQEQPTIETERLTLRPFTPADAADISRLLGDREIADNTLSIPYPYEEGMAEIWIAKQTAEWENGAGVNFAVVLRETGELVGAMGIGVNPEHRRAALGYWIGVPYWGRGFATESAAAVVGFGFETFDLHKVHASHFASNPASGRVMVKIGMTREGCRPEQIRKGDRFEDQTLYGILRRDFEHRRTPA